MTTRINHYASAILGNFAFKCDAIFKAFYGRIDDEYDTMYDNWFVSLTSLDSYIADCMYKTPWSFKESEAQKMHDKLNMRYFILNDKLRETTGLDLVQIGL